jgi:hypothetical protein
MRRQPNRVTLPNGEQVETCNRIGVRLPIGEQVETCNLPMVAVVELDVLKLLGPLHTRMRRIPVAEVSTRRRKHQ